MACGICPDVGRWAYRGIRKEDKGDQFGGGLGLLLVAVDIEPVEFGLKDGLRDQAARFLNRGCEGNVLDLSGLTCCKHIFGAEAAAIEGKAQGPEVMVGHPVHALDAFSERINRIGGPWFVEEP